MTSLLDRYHNHNLGNPNRLEWFISLEIHDDPAVTQNTLLCFRTSKTIILTINRVQDEFENGFDGSRATDPATLYRDYLAGKRLYWPAFAMKDYPHSHIDSRDFRLVEAAPSPAPADFRFPAPMGARSLSLRIAGWGCINQAVRCLRMIIPARLSALTRKSF